MPPPVPDSILDANLPGFLKTAFQIAGIWDDMLQSEQEVLAAWASFKNLLFVMLAGYVLWKMPADVVLIGSVVFGVLIVLLGPYLLDLFLWFFGVFIDTAMQYPIYIIGGMYLIKILASRGLQKFFVECLGADHDGDGDFDFMDVIDFLADKTSCGKYLGLHLLHDWVSRHHLFQPAVTPEAILKQVQEIEKMKEMNARKDKEAVNEKLRPKSLNYQIAEKLCATIAEKHAQQDEHAHEGEDNTPDCPEDDAQLHGSSDKPASLPQASVAQWATLPQAGVGQWPSTLPSSTSLTDRSSLGESSASKFSTAISVVRSASAFKSKLKSHELQAVLGGISTVDQSLFDDKMDEMRKALPSREASVLKKALQDTNGDVAMAIAKVRAEMGGKGNGLSAMV